MFHTKKILNGLMTFSLLVSVGFVALGFTGPIAALAAGPAPVDLLSAGDFVILGETAITTTGATSIVGDIGISPTTATGIDRIRVDNGWLRHIFDISTCYRKNI